MVKYFSRFIDVTYLPDMARKIVTLRLSNMSARYGCPNTLFTDNGPQFGSQQLQDFAKPLTSFHQFHSMSSPLNLYHPILGGSPGILYFIPSQWSISQVYDLANLNRGAIHFIMGKHIHRPPSAVSDGLLTSHESRANEGPPRTILLSNAEKHMCRPVLPDVQATVFWP